MSVSTTTRERGAVSIFVVVFAALLLTIATISFVRLMVRDQGQASTLDLSQSAYDSAQAGVEDAKRALLRMQYICSTSDESACRDALSKLSSATCNAGLDGIVDVSASEVVVQQSGQDSSLNQAYTCVKISPNTSDFLGDVTTNASTVIPLAGVADFSRVKIEWYSTDDIGSHGGDFSLNLPTTSSTLLPAQSEWSLRRPSVLRAQLIQVGETFRLSDFDNSSGAQSNANTLFLYPTSNALSQAQSFLDRDIRRNASGAPLPVRCEPTLAQGGYACSVTLDLPAPIGGGERTSYLRLSALYNATHFRVSLLDGTTPVQLNGVQPEIDSTGRANDLFRRVVTRVQLFDAAFPYPNAAVSVAGNFCKDFIVTNVTQDYVSGCQARNDTIPPGDEDDGDSEEHEDGEEGEDDGLGDDD